MHDEAGFLSAIRQTPADDVTRLVFADWLDEQDDPGCKLKAEFIRLELRMAETPEKSLNRVRWLRQLQKLAAEINPSWLAVVSHPKLEACRMSFQFACPKQWDQLKPTDDAAVRFCETCKKNVYFCHTLQEAQTHAANSVCIALSVTLVRPFADRPPRPGPPKFLASRRPSRILSHIHRGFSTIGRIAQPVVTPPPPTPLTPVETAPESVTLVETPPEPVPSTDPERRLRGRPNQKRQRRRRNIQRENWEELE